MRNYYRLKIKNKGYFINPITGDQLNGGFLYYLSLVNKELFQLFFDTFLKDNPPFLFSSFFPSGYLPINSQFIVSALVENLSKDETKSLKKISFLPVDFFSKFSQLNKDNLLSISQEKIFNIKKLAKVSIKNDTLYNEQLITFSSNMIDLYLFIENFDFDDIKNYLEEFICFFVGKKVSVGFSNFSLISGSKMDNLGSGDYFINLSPFIPKRKENEWYQPLFFDFFIKYPKLGFYFGGKNPFKKKIIMIKEGSVFKKKEGRKFEYAGLILNNISSFFPSSRQICYSFFYNFSLR